MLRMIFKKKKNIPLRDDFLEEFKQKNRNPLKRALYTYDVHENSTQLVFEIGQKGYEKNLKAFVMLMLYLSTLSENYLDNYVRKVKKKSAIFFARDKHGLTLKAIFMKMNEEEFEMFMKNIKPNLERFKTCLLTNDFTEFLMHDDCADMLYSFQNMQKYIIGLLSFKNDTEDFIEKRFGLKLEKFMFYIPVPKVKGASELCEVPQCKKKATRHVEMEDGTLSMCEKHAEAFELAKSMGKLVKK